MMGILGFVASVIFSVSFNSYVKSQEDDSDKLDQIYVTMVTQAIRDSLQNVTINQIKIDAARDKEETMEAMHQLMQSMMIAQQQLSEIQRDEVEQQNKN